MAVSKKLRFDVLSRDNHCCMYCGRKPPYVMLEVDHIIPKKKWWSDILDNLITSCFDCNRWKWWHTKEESDWKEYKKDIEYTKIKMKDYLYEKWNRNYMWTISKNTYILLKMYIDTIINEDSIKEDISIDNYLNDKDNSYELFMASNIHRKEILDRQYGNWCNDIDNIIEKAFDDENRTVKERYWSKLNHALTEELSLLYDQKDYYILRKFTEYNYLLEK